MQVSDTVHGWPAMHRWHARLVAAAAAHRWVAVFFFFFLFEFITSTCSCSAIVIDAMERPN
jgi:hypothetical protein